MKIQNTTKIDMQIPYRVKMKSNKRWYKVRGMAKGSFAIRNPTTKKLDWLPAYYFEGFKGVWFMEVGTKV
jgi:hypothetical protein